MRRRAKRGRALRRLLPLALLLSAFLAAPTAAETPPTSYVIEGGVGAMAMAPDGTLWFTAGYGDLGRIRPDGSFEVVGQIPRGYEGDLTVDPDGNLWLASWGAFSPGLMRVTPAGETTVFPLPEELGELGELIVGPGGIWLTSWRRSKVPGVERGTGPAYVSRVASDGGVAKFKLPGPSRLRVVAPGGIALGPDGNLWVADSALRRIHRISPAGRIDSFKLPVSVPRSITAGPDGALWFAAEDEIGRITPTGKVTRFPLPYVSAAQIITGPDGNLWFGDNAHVGRMTPWGQASTFGVGGIGLSGLVAGRDGGIWIGTTANPIKHVFNGWIEKLPTGLPGVEIASRKAIVRDGRFALSLECGGSPTRGCTGEVRLRRGRKELALGSYALAPESRGTVRLRLPGFAQRRLAGQRFWRGHFRVPVEDGIQATRDVVLQNPRFSR